MSQYETLAADCESDIRAGRVARSARRLASLNLAQVPRPWRLPLSRLCRRSGLVVMGLRLLTPLIRAPLGGLPVKPTEEERAEYGVLLQINGSVDEAVALLDPLVVVRHPDALLYRSFCHFNRWEYRESIPLLQDYCELPLQPYASLVGRVNLSAALAMAKEHSAALDSIGQALAAAKGGGFLRLEANCLELRAQVHLQSADDERARDDLENAVRLLGAANIPDTLFIQKWKAVLEARKSGSIEPFEALRTEARSRRVWETFREADLLELQVRFSQARFERLYYGTPFTAYRRRIAEELGERPLRPHVRIGGESAPCFDVEAGCFGEARILKPGSKAHQVLEVLARDLYKPIGVGGLFFELFPGEHFDIFSSPDRIHQIVRRTRNQLKSLKLPLQILEEKGRYRLAADGDVAFLLPLNKSRADWYEIQMKKLSVEPPPRYRACELKERLALTEAEYKRFLKWALEQGRLQRTYDGPTPLYEIAGRRIFAQAA